MRILPAPTKELDPSVPFDALLLNAMRSKCDEVLPGVLAHVVTGGFHEVRVRAVMAAEPRIPGAVGRWLGSLPRDRRIVVPAVVSPRLVGMLERRGFVHAWWWDDELGMPDQGAWIREMQA